MSVLVVGCGYLGERVAKRFKAQGHEVIGWAHSQASVQRLVEEVGIEGGEVDIRNKMACREGEYSTGIVDVGIMCVSTRGSGKRGIESLEAYQETYLKGARNLLSVFPDTKWIYTSSTSVYGQTGGEEVDETAETEPMSATSRVLLEVESEFLRMGGDVLRLAGLYGEGRSVYLRNFLEGQGKIEGDGSRIVNQIHVEDAADAVLTVAGRDKGGEIYNVVDDTPMTQQALYELLVKYLGGKLPETVEPDYQKKRGWTSKRVLNGKLKQLGWTPHYPGFETFLNP